MAVELKLPVVSGRSKADRVAETLDAHIRENSLPPGTFLGTKAELRTQLSVSPVTLDTALGILVDRGLVDLRPGVKGGVRVAESSHSLRLARVAWPVEGGPESEVEAGQAMALYLALQPHIVARAVHSAGAADRRTLRSARDRLQRATKDPLTYHEAHLALHVALVDASHDVVLGHVVRGLFETLDRTVGPPAPDGTVDAEAWIAERIGLHVSVVEAVLARDLDAAWTALLDHGISANDAESDGILLPAGALDVDRRWRSGVERGSRTRG